jgi:hypothetical protein
MAIIVQDSFNRANSTTSMGVADTGQTWEEIVGNWGINSNQAYFTGGTTNNIAGIESGVSDCRISVNIATLSGEPGLTFRIQDTTNWFRLIYSGGRFYLQRAVNGIRNEVSNVPATVTNGSLLVVELQGNSIRVFLNGTQIISVTNTSFATATKHGLHMGANNATARYDDFLIEDFNTGGGDTGTDGSITLGLTQQIYSDSSVNLSLSQQIYADISANLDLIISIYKDTEAFLPLTQAIYRDSEIGLNLTQEIYAEAESILNLIQEFYEDSQTYITLQLIQQIYKDDSADLPMTQAIYQDSEISLPLTQQVYEEQELLLPLTQTIYKDDSSVLNLSQTIFRDSQQTLNLVQQMFVDGEISLPLLIQIRDDLVNLIGTIRLKGQRILNVYLQGKRELNVTLKGGIDVTAINQNFSMYAGDTKNLVVTMPEDITGASVKWVLKQKYATDHRVLKTTSDGISISGMDITIKLLPIDTAALHGTYHHECEVTDQLGNVSTIFTGMVTISKSGV